MEVEIKSSDGRFVADVNIGDPDNPMIEVHDSNVLLRFDGLEVRIGELTSLKSSEQGREKHSGWVQREGTTNG